MVDSESSRCRSSHHWRIIFFAPEIGGVFVLDIVQIGRLVVGSTILLVRVIRTIGNRVAYAFTGNTSVWRRPTGELTRRIAVAAMQRLFGDRVAIVGHPIGVAVLSGRCFAFAVWMERMVTGKVGTILVGSGCGGCVRELCLCVEIRNVHAEPWWMGQVFAKKMCCGRACSQTPWKLW